MKIMIKVISFPSLAKLYPYMENPLSISTTSYSIPILKSQLISFSHLATLFIFSNPSYFLPSLVSLSLISNHS